MLSPISSRAPRAYSVEGTVKPTLIGVNYTGSFVPQKSGRFRLYGRADDVLVVRMNNKIILDASWDQERYSEWIRDEDALEYDMENERFLFGIDQPGVSGDWFTMTQGRSIDIDVFIAEVPGGFFGAYLLLEEYGVPGYKVFLPAPSAIKIRTLYAAPIQMPLDSYSRGA